MIRTAPIHYTANPDAWRQLLTALGGTVVVDSPGWVVARAGRGVVSLHGPSPAKASGQTELWFEASEPESSAHATGGEVTAMDLGGDLGTVWSSRLPDGQLVGYSPLDDSSEVRPGRCPSCPSG